MMKLKDIPQFTRESNYRVNVSFLFLIECLEHYKSSQDKFGYKFELCPDFQRGHVWTEQQQIKYIEFLLKGGKSGREIYFNHSGWQGDYIGDMVLVDGLQRITAAIRFINNEIKVFDHYLSEYEDKQILLRKIDLIFNVNNLQTKKEILKWYIEMNAGGTPHTEEEINRVIEMMEKE